TAGSSMGVSGGTGDGGTCGSGSTTCSPVHTDSKPAASAACATRAAVWPLAHTPMLMPNSPNRMVFRRQRTETQTPTDGHRRAGAANPPSAPTRCDASALHVYLRHGCRDALTKRVLCRPMRCAIWQGHCGASEKMMADHITHDPIYNTV